MPISTLNGKNVTPFYTSLAPGLKSPQNPGKPSPNTNSASTPTGNVPYVVAPNGTYQPTEQYKAAAKLPTTKPDATGKQVTDSALVAARNAALAKAEADGLNDPNVVKSYNPAKTTAVKASPSKIVSSDPATLGVPPNPLIADARMIAKAGDLVDLSGIIAADGTNSVQFTNYKIAVRDAANGGDGAGQLLVNGQPATAVGGIYTLTADEFATAVYQVGASEQSDQLLVAGYVDAQASGGRTQYSTPLAVTITSGAYRSLNAAGAIYNNTPGGSDPTLDLAQNAALYRPLNGQQRPTVTAAATRINLQPGESLQLGSLIAANVPNGGTISGYNIALGGSDGTAHGTLTLDGTVLDPTQMAQLTPDQLVRLVFTAEDTSTLQASFITVSAITTQYNASGSNKIASVPLQLTLSNFGTETLAVASNIAAPLGPGGVPNNGNNGYLTLAQNASILTGARGAGQQAVLTAESNTSSASGDVLQLSNLLKITDPKSGAISRFQLALVGSDGSAASGYLTLDGGTTNLANDPTYYDVGSGIYTINATDLYNLQFQAGASGSTDQILITAINDVLNPQTGLTTQVYSTPVQITNSVTDTRSLNLAGAVANKNAPDAWFKVADDAVIFAARLGQTASNLTTPGNFSIASGDKVSLASLISASDATTRDGSILPVTRYEIALKNDGGGAGSGKLYLLQNGAQIDVTTQGSFTAEELRNLIYQSDPSSGAYTDQMIVAAFSEQKSTDGLGIVTSTIASVANAFNISVAPDGARTASIADAVSFDGTDDFYAVIQAAKIFYRDGQSPTIASPIGNFSLASGQRILLSDAIIANAASTGGEVNYYRVALDTNGLTDGGGQIILDGKVVGGFGVPPGQVRTEFTANEFARLVYLSGTPGVTTSIAVAAEVRALPAASPIYSPALVINATSGLNSLNIAGNVLGASGSGSTADGFTALAQNAQIYRAFGGAALNLVTNLQGDYGDSGATTTLSPLVDVQPGQNTVLVVGNNVAVGDTVSYVGLPSFLNNIGVNPALPNQALTNVTQISPTSIVTLDTPLGTGLIGNSDVIEIQRQVGGTIQQVGNGLVALKLDSPANSARIFLDPSLGVQPGDVILDAAGNIIGTVTNVQSAQAVTVSNPFIRGIGSMDELMFQKTSLAAQAGTQIGQYRSTAPIDRTNFRNFSAEAVWGQNGYGIVSGFAAPGVQATRTALFLLNSNQIGGYQTSDQTNNRKRTLTVG